MRSGPNLPRVDAGLGQVPRPSCPGGFSMDSPSPHACGRVYGDTLAQSFAFCNGGLAGFFLDGWSCCGLRPPSTEGSVWPAPLSRPHRPPTFSRTGGPPVPPAGAAPPAPCLGEGMFSGLAAVGARFPSYLLQRSRLASLPQFVASWALGGMTTMLFVPKVPWTQPGSRSFFPLVLQQGFNDPQDRLVQKMGPPCRCNITGGTTIGATSTHIVAGGCHARHAPHLGYEMEEEHKCHS